jgi:hypothetical protein
MRRSLVAVVGIALALGACSAGGPPAATGPSHLETASLSSPAPARSAPLAKAPKPKYTRAIYASVRLAGSSVMLDACHGPIAIDLGEARPVLVAEHDYCGGSAWMPRLQMHDAVRLTGDGIDPGTYVVTEIRYQIRRQAKVSDLPATQVVLQTCVTKNKMVLVGLERFNPALQS